MNSKRSRLQRKYVNAMRQMGDVPRPARRFKYPPTFGSRRCYAALTPRRARRAERMLNRLARQHQQTQEMLQRAAASREEANRRRRGLFRRGGESRARAFAGRIFSRRKV